MAYLEISSITRSTWRVIEEENHLVAERTEINCLLPDSLPVPTFPSRFQDGLAEFSGFLGCGESEGFEVLLAPLRHIFFRTFQKRRIR